MAGFYLKLFLAAFSVVFAGAAGINLFKMAPAAAFLGALYPAVFFAVIMAFAAGPVHASLSKKIAGAGYGPEIYRTRQSAEFSIGLEYEKLFSLAHRYLKEKAGFEILEADTRARRITGKSPLSLKTFGNIITLEFREDSQILTNLKISSRPRFATTLMDYGENLKIVLDAKSYLNQNAGQQ
jgi:hypothetical protein